MNIPVEKLPQLARALSKPGKAIDGGCKLQDVPMYIKRLQETSNKPYCVVSGWCIWNIEFEIHAVHALKEFRLEPKIVYATHVIDDQRQRWSNGSHVRTTLLINLHDRCVFETQNTFYILVGNGTEKSISSDIAVSVYF